MALRSSPENPQPLRTIVAATKSWIERLGPVWVEAQLIELKRRVGAGTHFLTLRDKLAEVSVTVSTSTAVLDQAGPLQEGAQVTALLRPTLWSRSGSLTFECAEIRPSGEGRLLAAIEQRKRMLQAEGLFNPALKKRLPFLPRRIGLITARDSAAERDVVQVVARRWPAARWEIRHCLMQGQGCVEQVRDALAALDRTPAVDVIVIARGGGSLEDLLPFSDESLVRAVFACRTPVVSAIGHESDTPILDLVADVRASTPTDAAKRMVPDAAEEHQRLNRALAGIRATLLHRVGTERRRLADLRSRPVLRAPTAVLDVQAERLTTLTRRMERAVHGTLRHEHLALGHAIGRVRALSPQATLQRGYAILSDADGGTVASVAEVTVDQTIDARLQDGTLALRVQTIDQEDA